MAVSLHRPRERERLATIVVWGAALACVLAIAHRMRCATDLTDEGFTLAMPYRFALGDKPFVDEISIQQTAGFLLYPFVWLYVKISGGSTGLVLYSRWVHLAVFKGAAALGVYAAARRWLKFRSTAVAVCLVLLAFVPFSIPSPGYNVIGMTMLAAGSFLTAAAMAEPNLRLRTRLLLLAGLAEGFMVIAYPPLAVVVMIATPLVLILAPTQRIKALAAFVAGGAAAALLISPALLFGGMAGVRRSLAWGIHAAPSHMTVAAKVMVVIESLWKAAPPFTGYAVAAVALAWIVRWRPLVALVIPGITLAYGLLYRDESTVGWAANSTVIFVGFLAPALVVLARPDAALWRGVALVAMPSFVGGIVSGYISANGANNAFVGLYASVALFAALAARALERVPADPTFCALPALALSFVLLTRYYDFVYRDVPLAQLTDVVRAGPFKGIKTTADRAEMFEELERITKTYDQKGGRILFLYESPGFYLFSRMPPSASCVWEVHHAGQDTLLEYWRRYPKGRGLVVYIKGTPHGAIDGEVAPADHRVMETRHFVVYRDT